MSAALELRSLRALSISSKDFVGVGVSVGVSDGDTVIVSGLAVVLTGVFGFFDIQRAMRATIAIINIIQMAPWPFCLFSNILILIINQLLCILALCFLSIITIFE
jgi:hypothetical protein